MFGAPPPDSNALAAFITFHGYKGLYPPLKLADSLHRQDSSSIMHRSHREIADAKTTAHSNLELPMDLGDAAFKDRRISEKETCAHFVEPHGFK